MTFCHSCPSLILVKDIDATYSIHLGSHKGLHPCLQILDFTWCVRGDKHARLHYLPQFITTVKSFIEYPIKVSYLTAKGPSREPLLNGKDQYGWPPWTNTFRSAAFDYAKNIYFFTKQATLMRRSTVLSLPVQLVFPGPSHKNDW